MILSFRASSSTYENPPRSTQYQSTKRADNLQADVNQVVDIMKDNLEKVLERDAKLTTLENRAGGLKLKVALSILMNNCLISDILQTGASQFTTNASKLKRKYWWKNLKMWAILIIVIIVLIIVIVVAVTQSVKSNNSGSNNNNGNQNNTDYFFFICKSPFLHNMSNNGGGAPAPGGGGSKRLAQQQAQVDEVVDIMRQNVDKVLERDKNLSLLDDRADKLQHNAAQFEQHAGKLKRKYWWKNMKYPLACIVMCLKAILISNINRIDFYLAWIASKVKAVTPALPANEATTPVLMLNNDGKNLVAGSAIVAPGEKPTTRRRKGKKTKKTTKMVSTTVATNNDEGRSPDGDDNDDEEDDGKTAGKRKTRALLQF
ncbi:hypothetical protein I4U23_014229 [Adineta vaga]|nr:hypothetical protein I4U23_014229 [Adineta vaga]